MTDVETDTLPEPVAPKKKKQMSKEYMRQYYHDHKGENTCEFCGNIYMSKSGVVKHQRGSTKCFVKQLKDNSNVPLTIMDLKNAMDAWVKKAME